MNNAIRQHTLTNTNGMSVELINYGGTITKILAPGANGTWQDVVLGYDTPEEYRQSNNPFFGCITGRFANRIAKGRFSIDGHPYQLPVNNGPNTLHGGIEGFNRKIWAMEQPSPRSIAFTYTSKDGEEGFPGTLQSEVVYTLSDDNALRIDYTSTSDKPTVINLTNHTYFNLSPDDPTIVAHEVLLNADRFVAVNDEYIPTGVLQQVEGSVMDFRTPKPVGRDLPNIAGGFDHTWIINNNGRQPALAGTVYHRACGRYLEVFTTQPGMQFYTGNFLNGTVTGKGGRKYIQHAGLCLETQHFPDSPNHPSFPNTILRPGEVYRETTIYKFSVK